MFIWRQLGDHQCGNAACFQPEKPRVSKRNELPQDAVLAAVAHVLHYLHEISEIFAWARIGSAFHRNLRCTIAENIDMKCYLQHFRKLLKVVQVSQAAPDQPSSPSTETPCISPSPRYENVVGRLKNDFFRSLSHLSLPTLSHVMKLGTDLGEEVMMMRETE